VGGDLVLGVGSPSPSSRIGLIFSLKKWGKAICDRVRMIAEMCYIVTFYPVFIYLQSAPLTRFRTL
jgi:hypothetical protein